jgi:Spy/CpxP family protein refolding chaperone
MFPARPGRTMPSSPPFEEATMRPWIKRTLFGLLGAGVALGALTACGHRYGHERLATMSSEEQAQFRSRMVERAARRLDLDAAQKARLAALFDTLHAQRLALRGATDPRAEVRALVAGDKFDRAKAQALLGAKMAALSSGSPEVITAFGEFFDGLSPAQQARVREFMQGRHGWWHRG